MMIFLMTIFALVGLFGFLMTHTGAGLRKSVFRTRTDESYQVAPTIKRRAGQTRMQPAMAPVQQRPAFGKR